MSYFRVTGEALVAAGQRMIEGESCVRLQAAGLGGAGAGTPAAAACQELVSHLETAAGSAEQALASLSQALQDAGAAYQLADQVAAESLALQKG